ncbi:MAG: AP2 domain-containing protein [Chloroflexi bacterium]|nr:AP2 domain-containing protein [Chloroflexota bacterium]
MKSISRIDQPEKNNHGYYVRVSFRGKQHRKFFNDKKYGGEEDALEAAIKYRNQLEKELGKPRTDRMVLAPKDKERAGVRRIRKQTRKNGKVYYSEVYEVQWCPEPGKVERKNFYISTLGEEEARRRAYELRRIKERRIYGKPIGDSS